MLSDMYYWIKHMLQKDKGICPKCGNNTFEHGFFPRNEFYCTRCGLWIEVLEERKKWIKQLEREGKI